MKPDFILLDSVDSTNNYAAKLIRSGKAQHGTTILTKRQTAGRGQRDSVWQSDTDENLLMSVILFPKLLADDLFLLNMAVSLAVQHALTSFGVHSVIKWPNDLLCLDPLRRAKKIAGILIENQLKGAAVSSSIVGIGLNVNQASFVGLSATSVRNETGVRNNPPELCEVILTALTGYLDDICSSRSALIHQTYLEHLYLFNTSYQFTVANSTFTGTIRGVDALGRIQIETAEGTKYFGNKEVQYTGLEESAS